MTRFERELHEAVAGDYQRIITRRRAELKEVEGKGRRSKNRFETQCLAQEFARLRRELDAIEEAVDATI